MAGVSRRPVAPRRPGRLSGGITTGVVLAFAVLWTLPTMGLFLTSLRPSENAAYDGWWSVITDHQVTLDNYREVLTGGDTLDEGIWPFFVNSIVIAVPVIIVGLTLASMTAFAVVWIPFRGARLVLGLIVALQIVPVQMALLPLQHLQEVHPTFAFGAFKVAEQFVADRRAITVVTLMTCPGIIGADVGGCGQPRQEHLGLLLVKILLVLREDAM